MKTDETAENREDAKPAGALTTAGLIARAKRESDKFSREVYASPPMPGHPGFEAAGIALDAYYIVNALVARLESLESASVPVKVMGVGDYDAKSFKSAKFTGPLVILSVSEDVARRFAGRLYEDACVVIVGSEVRT